jgi:hypothetical protein
VFYAFVSQATHDDVCAIEFHQVIPFITGIAHMTASSEKRETLNRDRFCNMTRRFQTHGAWPPGHLANPARIRHSAMHAPNRGALDRNGSADRCLWQGQQQKLNGKDGWAVTQTLKAIVRKNG